MTKINSVRECGVTVKTFNDDEVKEAIKQSAKIVREYIEAQQRALEGWSETMQWAVNKIRELSDTASRIRKEERERALKVLCRFCDHHTLDHPCKHLLGYCGKYEQFKSALEAEN